VQQPSGDTVGRRILIALELEDQSANDVLRKASSLRLPDDTLDVLHVVDPTTVLYTVDPTLTGRMYQRNYEAAMTDARNRIQVLCAPYDIDATHCHVRYGRVAHEVHELLRDVGYDTLMIGSHGWSGWRRLLGSRAASILHGVPVDTWVFKVGKAKT